MICSALASPLEAVVGISWLELTKVLAAAVTAVVAWLALRNWQRQDKAKREAEFLDSLIETTLAYVAEMPEPLTRLRLTMIGFRSREPLGDVDEKDIAGAIAYIDERGQEDYAGMISSLSSIRPFVDKLEMLVAKGQVFRFKGYPQCEQAASRLTLQFRRMEMFASIIGSQNWNWENPEVRDAIRKVVLLDPRDVSERLERNKIAVLEFATSAYRRLYG